ncbi:DUF6262 family protein [Streptomyces sp. SID12488]|uniref:DUF6262 family protein n=1 Tax=Streptomyces sp. SID12488 TaxID=2706040 RepID=UPI0013DBAB55|nr:DUF6262 family protein [Streptomyces sp. SID12488]NEA68123.1 DUF1192 family protein [Streptomyces sp. SID12488]
MNEAKRKPADALREARKRDSVAKRGQVLAAIDTMKDSGTPISFAAVARTAEVSTWLVYAAGVREHVEAAMKGQAKSVRRERKSGVGASAASLATDLELARAETRALRGERDRLKQAVQRSLGAQLDQRGTKELTGRVGELQAEVQRVKDELAAARADNAGLLRELEEARDEVVAVREAGRQMFKNVNRSG